MTSDPKKARDSQIILNLVTRTSNRPIFFSECQQSIQNQTYPAELIKKYVSFDSEDDVSYIQKYGTSMTLIEVEREKRKNQHHFPCHLYLNEILSQVQKLGSGWVMILDDDNLLAKPTSLDILAKKIQENGQDPKKFYVWKCQQPHRVIPSPVNFRKIPKAGDLHISAFCFHISQLNLVHFTESRGSEFDVISKLFNKLSCVWIDDILTQTQGSGNGTRMDKKESPEPKKKLSLKPKLSLTSNSGINSTSSAPNTISITTTTDTKPEISVTKRQFISADQKPNVQSTIVEIDAVSEEEEEEEEEEDLSDEYNEDGSEDEQEDEPDPRAKHIPKMKIQIAVPSQDPIPPGSLRLDDHELDTIQEDEHEDSEEIASNHTDETDEEEISNEDEQPDLDPEEEEEISNEESMEEVEIAADASSVTVTKTNSGSKVEVNPVVDETILRLINLLKSNRRIYILDENNMQKLSKCMFDAISCIDLEGKLINALEHNTLETKAHEVQKKLQHQPSVSKPSLTLMSSMPNLAESRLNNKSPGSSFDTQSNSKANFNYMTGSFVDMIYVLTDNDSDRNSVLDRNKKILNQGNLPHEIVRCKDMSLFNYQNHIREILKIAKSKDFRRIMILNGNDLLNHKFVDLYNKQIGQINDDCHLWFLGQTREITAKEILSTGFDLDDYLFLYEDIIKAKMTTQEKSHMHWKTYGHREGRYAKIEVTRSPNQPVVNNYGVVITSEVYDVLMDLIDRQNFRDCKNVFVLLQNDLVESKYVWISRPDLIIPQFANANNHTKNAQIGVRQGWYYNLYR